MMVHLSSTLLRTGDEDNQHKFVVGLILRVVSAGVFWLTLGILGSTGLAFPFAESWPAYLGVSLLVLVNGIYWVVAVRREFPINDFYVHWMVDLILITLVIIGLGGASLPSAITPYILIVITSAVFISSRASYAVAFGGSLIFSAVVVAEARGWLGMFPRYAAPDIPAGVEVFAVVAPTFMLFLVAFISGTLADELKAAQRLVQEKNADLAGKNVRLERLREEVEFQTRVLAHDVRSPVSAALGALGLLRSELADVLRGHSEADDLLRLIEENLERVDGMIDSLREAQYVDEADEGSESVDLGRIVDELEVEFGAVAAEKGAVVSPEGRLPLVKGSYKKLLTVFRNLVGNALRYVPSDGQGRVVVGATKRDGELTFFVKDNGQGIAADHQQVIFEMFRKAPQEERSKGLGLGLFLVRRIVEQLGGRVWVESDGRTGTTFWVRLPLVEAEPSVVDRSPPSPD